MTDETKERLETAREIERIAEIEGSVDEDGQEHRAVVIPREELCAILSRRDALMKLEGAMDGYAELITKTSSPRLLHLLRKAIEEKAQKKKELEANISVQHHRFRGT